MSDQTEVAGQTGVSGQSGVSGQTGVSSFKDIETLLLSLKVICGWVVYLFYSVNSGPFLRFYMRFEFPYEIHDNSVCETMDTSLTIS